MQNVTSNNDDWPFKGPEFNRWYVDLLEFIKIMDSVKGEFWWIVDFELKYLNLRIDTRDNAFVLSVDGKHISPTRVVDAINLYKKRYMGKK